MEKLSKEHENFNTESLTKNALETSKKLGKIFDNPEEQALRHLCKRTLEENFFTGEKPKTIVAILLYLVCKMSPNPELNKIDADKIA